jgi:hypothetical protein
MVSIAVVHPVVLGDPCLRRGATPQRVPIGRPTASASFAPTCRTRVARRGEVLMPFHPALARRTLLTSLLAAAWAPTDKAGHRERTGRQSTGSPHRHRSRRQRHRPRPADAARSQALTDPLGFLMTELGDVEVLVRALDLLGDELPFSDPATGALHPARLARLARATRPTGGELLRRARTGRALQNRHRRAGLPGPARRTVRSWRVRGRRGDQGVDVDGTVKSATGSRRS